MARRDHLDDGISPIAAYNAVMQEYIRASDDMREGSPLNDLRQMTFDEIRNPCCSFFTREGACGDPCPPLLEWRDGRALCPVHREVVEIARKRRKELKM